MYAGFSWAPSSNGTHNAGDVVPGPAGTNGGIIYTTDANDPLGSSATTSGAIVLHQSPSRIVWLDSSEFEIDYSATIPAGGSYQQTSDYVWSTSPAEVGSVANATWDGAQNPTVVFTSPANHATVTSSQINVTGTAADGVAVQSLTVNGKAVGVAGDGTWVAPVTLNPGANTITAVATNTSANQTTATLTVTYTPPTGGGTGGGGGGGTARVQCVVPNLIGDTLAKAQAALTAGHCVLGKVARVRQKQGAGTVVAQGTPAGWTNAGGSAVNVAVAAPIMTHRHHHGKHHH